MKTCECLFQLNKDTEIRKRGITPAQLQLLIVMHVANGSGAPVKELKETEEVNRTNAQEIQRLRMIYGSTKVKAMFGPNSPLPASFEEAKASGMAWAMENGEAGDEPLVGRKLTADESAAFIN